MQQNMSRTAKGPRERGDDGFTLVEVLIAIVLVGILSAVAVVGIGGLLGKGRASACTAERGALGTAVTAYLTVNDVAEIPHDETRGITPGDTLRASGLINEVSTMYTVQADGSLTAIPGNPNGCTDDSTETAATDATVPPYTGTTYSGTTYTGTTYTGTTYTGTNNTGSSISSFPSSPDRHGPENFDAVAGDGQATFTWSPSWTGDGPLTAYRITATVGGDFGCQAGPTDPLSCTITGLTNGTKYRFYILGQMTRAALGGEFLYVTPDRVNPVVEPMSYVGRPTVLTAVAGDGMATLTWSAPTEDGGYPLAGYTIIDWGGHPFTTCQVPVGQPLTCTLTGLQNGTTYRFVVSAHNEVGDQTASYPESQLTPGPAG